MASRKKVQNTHIGKQIRHLHGSLLDIVSLINRPQLDEVLIQDRKSTRLNSSHI